MSSPPVNNLSLEDDVPVNFDPDFEWKSCNLPRSLESTVDSPLCEISEYEARMYYAGIRPTCRGPLLIYRTSSDIFEEPSGPEQYAREMRAITVPDDHEFGKDGLWDRVRDKVVELLNQRHIKTTSVDFVRFTWLVPTSLYRKITKEESEDPEFWRPVNHHTNPTIWIGVLPDTLSRAVAHESAKDIHAFLDELQTKDIDIAYRESTFKFLHGHGSALFAPVEDIDALENVIDNVSVPLSLSIAGCKPTITQGTLGPYFRVGNKLYAITARHNLFPLTGDNEDFRHDDTAPKRGVAVMNTPMYRKYVASIWEHHRSLVSTVEDLERMVEGYRGKVESGIDVEESEAKLEAKDSELEWTHFKLREVKQFLYEIDEKWNKLEDRVIGFVVWAPSIGAGVAPHKYTRDFCVIELYKEKFKHMIGNVLGIGPADTGFLFKRSMYDLMSDRLNVRSEFEYLPDGLLPLSGVLTANDITNPLNVQDDRIRRVVKRGFATNTTVGSLSRYMSFVRKYFPTGSIESLELPILSHEERENMFSKEGDSGSLVVSASGEFVGLLTGGTCEGVDGPDMTFATVFEYIWNLVLEEFPGADLDFDDLETFLADVA